MEPTSQPKSGNGKGKSKGWADKGRKGVQGELQKLGNSKVSGSLAELQSRLRKTKKFRRMKEACLKAGLDADGPASLLARRLAGRKIVLSSTSSSSGSSSSSDSNDDSSSQPAKSAAKARSASAKAKSASAKAKRTPAKAKSAVGNVARAPAAHTADEKPGKAPRTNAPSQAASSHDSLQPVARRPFRSLLSNEVSVAPAACQPAPAIMAAAQSGVGDGTHVVEAPPPEILAAMKSDVCDAMGLLDEAEETASLADKRQLVKDAGRALQELQHESMGVSACPASDNDSDDDNEDDSDYDPEGEEEEKEEDVVVLSQEVRTPSDEQKSADSDKP
mmetsp:Transcript_38599/g.67170  ORF Transcript_38599/g.67170 Transcript_38599/m.67170 type:complete len:333 (+) Transcript_38599:40-1038(+)